MKQPEEQTEITLKQIEEPTNLWSFIMAGGLLGKRRRERERLAHPEGIPETQNFEGVACSKCGSSDVKAMTGLSAFLGGVVILWIGLALTIFIVGIPMVVAGWTRMSVDPFTDEVYQCQRCRKTWEPEVLR